MSDKSFCSRCEKYTDTRKMKCSNCKKRKYTNPSHTHNKKCRCKKCKIKRINKLKERIPVKKGN